MKKIYVGIDISKEKLNLCYLKDLAVIREEECENDVKGIKKSLKASFKALETLSEDILICAEYTGRYIYPLTVACQELDVFLWLDDPTRIKNSLGLTRGKNDAIDAIRIAEYAYRNSDKAVRYAIPDAALVSMKNLLSDREFLLTDKKRFQMQLSDQKKYMAPGDFKHKNSRWNKVIKTIDEQIKAIDAEIESLIAANQTMKTLLHMSAVNVATRMKEGEYKEYYERKLKEGKHKMCIFNVLRAKLVHRMFSVIKRDELYTKQYKPAF